MARDIGVSTAYSHRKVPYYADLDLDLYKLSDPESTPISITRRSNALTQPGGFSPTRGRRRSVQLFEPMQQQLSLALKNRRQKLRNRRQPEMDIFEAVPSPRGPPGGFSIMRGKRVVDAIPRLRYRDLGLI